MLTRSYMTTESNKKLVAYTPMLHSRLFTETEKFRSNAFLPMRTPLAVKPEFPYTGSEADLYLDGNPVIDRPLFVQFCANEPEVLLKAAEYVAPFCDAVDLNLGCPQGIAKKGAYGSFLQENQELIYRLINILHLNLAIPVTAKIRILETKEKTLEYATRVLKAGASILTVHGRVRDAKGHKTGLADWGYIRYLRDNLPKETVIFANGNILQHKDIEACLEATGADAVMSAEGNLYDPAIFAEPPAVGQEGHFYWRGIDGKGGFRMDDAMRRYMSILYKYVLEKPEPLRQPLYVPGQNAVEEPQSDEEGPARKRVKMDNGSEVTRANGATAAEVKSVKAQEKNAQKKQRERVSNPNLTPMQAHCFHMLRALVNKHHNVRDALAKSRAGDIEAYENVLSMVEEAVEKGIREYEATKGESYHAEFAAKPEEKGPLIDTFVPAVTKEGDMEDGAITKAPTEQAAIADPAAVVDAANVTADAAAKEAPSTDYQTSVKAVEECRRPWWVCQPYVRPLPLEAVLKGSLTLSKKEMENLTQEEKEKAMSRGMYKNAPGAVQLSKKEQKRLRKEEAKKAAKARNARQEDEVTLEQ